MAMAPPMNVMRRLKFDLEELIKSPVANVSAAPLEDNMLEWHCNIRQDENVYHLILFFPDKYPYTAPSAEFLPEGLRFPNATKRGKKGTQICLSIFSDYADIHREWAGQIGLGWSPGYTIQSVLMNVVVYLSETKCSMDKDLSQSFECPDCGHTYEKPCPAFNNDSEPSIPMSGTEGIAAEICCVENGPSAKEPEAADATDAADAADAADVADVADAADATDVGADGADVGADDADVGADGADVAADAATDAVAEETSRPAIIDYISKESFSLEKPASREDLFGFGLIMTGPGLTTPCEFLTGKSYYVMKAATNVAHSILNKELHVFLPLFIHPTHGAGIKDEFETCLKEVAGLTPSFNFNPDTTSFNELIIKTICNLLNTSMTTAAEDSEGLKNISDSTMHGYFALHRLFLWALDTYPGLEEMVESKLERFAESEENRSKKLYPNLAEIIVLLSASKKYRWQDLADAYIGESFRRDVFTYVHKNCRMGYLSTDKAYRLRNTFKHTEVSRRIIAFQVLFLETALPCDMSRDDVIKTYDGNMGFLSSDIIARMKTACNKINDEMNTYPDWFNMIQLPVPTEDSLFSLLVESVRFAIITEGYHDDRYAWSTVLKRYEKDMKTSAGRARSAVESNGKRTRRRETHMEVDQEPMVTRSRKRKMEEDDNDKVYDENKGGRRAKLRRT